MQLLPYPQRLWGLPALTAAFILYMVLSSRRVYGTGWAKTTVFSLIVLQLFLVASMSVLGGAVVLFHEDPTVTLREVDATTRAHQAEALLRVDSARTALDIARQGW